MKPSKASGNESGTLADWHGQFGSISAMRLHADVDAAGLLGPQGSVHGDRLLLRALGDIRKVQMRGKHHLRSNRLVRTRLGSF